MVKGGKTPRYDTDQKAKHDLESGTHSRFNALPTVMDGKQGKRLSLAHLAETGKLPALRKIGRGGSDETLASLDKSWRYHRQEFGSTDTKTVARLFDLCRCWNTLGMLRDAVGTEAPHILSWTIKARNTEFFDFLLQQQVDVDRPDEEGKTPLFHASTSGKAFIVRRLLDAGANVHCTAGSVTPLHVSAEKNYTSIVDYLLEAGADVNALNSKGNTALYWASNNGNLEMVRKLLGKGGQANHTAPSTISPLHVAAVRGHVEIVEVLLDAGADLNARNFEMTPVLVAISYQQERVLDCLLTRGAIANPSLGEKFALHFAAGKGSRSIVTLLLDAGVGVNTTSAKGHTALHIAAALGNEDLVDRLLARSASVNLKSMSGFTALHDASLAGHIVVVKQLLYAGADIASTTCTDYTALHFAAEKGSLDVVKRLMEAGSDVNAQSIRKWTPLLCACREKHLAVVEFLLDHGANPDLLDSQGVSPLIIASENGDLGIVRKLVCDYSANVNSQSMNGVTALHMAAQNGHASVVSFLLNNEADANMLFLGNTTPLAMATWHLHTDVINHLIPVTKDPCILDCFGWNSIDWATANPSVLSKISLETRPEEYIPTSVATRKSHVRRNISNLARAMLQANVANDNRLPVLGECLLIMHDTTDAEHAFQLQVHPYATTAEGPLTYWLACNSCETDITGNLYICLTCADTALCEDCMTKYKDKTKEMRTCKDHVYHGILSHRHWEGEYGKWPSQLVNTRGQSVDEWLRHVLVAYGG